MGLHVTNFCYIKFKSIEMIAISMFREKNNFKIVLNRDSNEFELKQRRLTGDLMNVN